MFIVCLQGIDTMIPVDVYVPGCPPAPEGVIHALMRLQDMVAKGETHSQRQLAQRKKRCKRLRFEIEKEVMRMDIRHPFQRMAAIGYKVWRYYGKNKPPN